MTPIEDVKEKEITPPQVVKGMRLVSNAILRKQALAAEKKLKGFYNDWLFDKLNLSKHR